MVPLKTYYLDVKDAVRVLHRFELRFLDDSEAIQHSKELAAMFRQRRVPDEHGGLAITVLDQSNRKIHEETIDPPRPATNLTSEAAILDDHDPAATIVPASLRPPNCSGLRMRRRPRNHGRWPIAFTSSSTGPCPCAAASKSVSLTAGPLDISIGMI